MNERLDIDDFRSAIVDLPEIRDYRQGWRDCRTYAGQAEGGSAAYKQGFTDCLRAYHNAGNWVDVPAEGASDE